MLPVPLSSSLLWAFLNAMASLAICITFMRGSTRPFYTAFLGIESLTPHCSWNSWQTLVLGSGWSSCLRLLIVQLGVDFEVGDLKSKVGEKVPYGRIGDPELGTTHNMEINGHTKHCLGQIRVELLFDVLSEL